MAYKSLIDYYGGGMVKPSGGGTAKQAKGYYLGGQVSDFSVKSQSSEDRRVLQKKVEADQAKRGGGAASFTMGLIGTGLGTLIGQPQLGGLIGSAWGQKYTEDKYKPTDLSGGLYALDVADRYTKEQQDYKKGGTGRIAKAGFMGYIGGGEGGMFSDIWKGAGKFHKANVARKAAGVASKAQAALTPLERGSQLGSEYVERVGSGAEAFEPSNLGIEFSDRNITRSSAGVNMTGGEEWMVPDTSVAGQVQDFSSNIDSGSKELFYNNLSKASTNPAVQPIYDPSPASVAGISGVGPLAEGLVGGSASQGAGSGENLYNMISGSYDYGGGDDPYQVQTAGGYAGGNEGGFGAGLMNMFMPSRTRPRIGFQEGGQVGYGTAQTPEEALRQVGMGDVVDDPRFDKYLDDAPQFGLGFSQKMGDITAGARTGLLNIGEQERLTGAKTGFAGGGGWMNPSARKEVQRQYGTQKRGVGEDYASSVLSWLGNVEQEAGIKFGEDKSRPDWAQDVPADDPGWNPPSGTEGATYNFNGTNWVFSGGSWMTVEEQEQSALYAEQSDSDYGP
jgi:hypothetical protein